MLCSWLRNKPEIHVSSKTIIPLAKLDAMRDLYDFAGVSCFVLANNFNYYPATVTRLVQDYTSHTYQGLGRRPNRNPDTSWLRGFTKTRAGYTGPATAPPVEWAWEWSYASFYIAQLEAKKGRALNFVEYRSALLRVRHIAEVIDGTKLHINRTIQCKWVRPGAAGYLA